MKKENTSNKLAELEAIATFNQEGVVGVEQVSPPTAKAILLFYNKLDTKDLKKKFLTFDAKTMKTIALGITDGKASVQLTPEAKAMLNFGKHAVNGANIVWNKVKAELNKKAKKEEPKL